ncbi:MAG: NAD(P)H-hydrate dehydratase [Bacteroides sp.]|nr:NAD(P)H-hydrate dehydratase [Bacteroides sp.]
MKILPTALVKQLDAYTIEHEPIASIDLMERAAQALSDAIAMRYMERATPFVVFAGPGNNGGDALAVARLLATYGYSLQVYLFNPKGKLSPDCEVNRERLLALGGQVDFHEVTTSFMPPKLTAETVVIDGLFGSGLNQPLSGGFAMVVKFINASPAQVVSIDLPSGLMGEDNSLNVEAHIVKATLTLSLQLPKLAFFLPENAPYVGEWQLLDIGLSREAIAEAENSYALTEAWEMKGVLKPRKRFAHKGDFGRGMLIAGSQGMAGASILAARACLRSGIGLLKVHVPLCNNVILQTAVPEAMTDLDAHVGYFSEVAACDGCQAVAIGPGLGREQATANALLKQIDACNVPMVVDADALNLLEAHRTYLQRLPAGSILTPHPGEMDRLVGRCANGYDRLQQARELAMDARVCLVLKGAWTAVIAPDGRVWFNPTGNPGMATGGSGDVLTGILLALLAQGYDSLQAARLGVYVHGLAGDLATARLGQLSLTAGDLIEALPEAFTSCM